MKFISAGAGVALMLAAGSSRSEISQCPNVVLIIADDHRADWMGHKGVPFMETPMLDRLAAEGVSFKNAFACSGVCSPARASILTGRYAHRASAPEIIWQNNSFLKTQVTFVRHLKNAGYRTAYVGKLHLGEDELPKPEFDEWIGFPFVGRFNDQPLWINGIKTEQKGFTDDRLAALAAERIRDWGGKSEPFCLILGLKAPHEPFDFPERMQNHLSGTVFEKPDTWSLRKPGLEGNCLPAEEFRAAIPAYGSYENWLRSYSRLALTIDESVGTVVRALEESGSLDNTLLIYTSDQGYSLGEFGLSGKHFAYEQVMRVPMVVRYPAMIPAGSQCERMVLNIDIAPTVLDVARAEPLEGADGKSWRDLFQSSSAVWRDEFFFSFYNDFAKALPPMHAVRSDRYKLIEYEAKPVRELYDLENDPLEMENLYEREEFAGIRAQMKARLDRLKSSIGYSPRECRLLESAYVTGPVQAGEEAGLRQMLAGGVLPAEARRMNQPFRLPVRGIGPGDVFYVIIPVVKKTEFDPNITFQLFEEGGFRQWKRNDIPASAWLGSERLWINKPGAKAERMPYEPIGQFNDKCNFPLVTGRTLVAFRCIAPLDLPVVQIEVQAPAGAVEFTD